jgi:hypothetical protein
VFVAHQHPRINSVLAQSDVLTIRCSSGTAEVVMRG